MQEREINTEYVKERQAEYLFMLGYFLTSKRRLFSLIDLLFSYLIKSLQTRPSPLPRAYKFGLIVQKNSSLPCG